MKAALLAQSIGRNSDGYQEILIDGVVYELSESWNGKVVVRVDRTPLFALRVERDNGIIDYLYAKNEAEEKRLSVIAAAKDLKIDTKRASA
jgi:hypothetical protein